MAAFVTGNSARIPVFTGTFSPFGGLKGGAA
jgi:hypothetical protein